tara:strand:+ start:1331 stop:1552 length:222 start_codon:yes stop_codon:yes gene_type:complete
MGSTKKTGKGRFVGRAEIKNEDRRMRRAEAKEEIAQNLRDVSRMRIPVKKGIEDIMDKMYHHADWVITGDEEE